MLKNIKQKLKMVRVKSLFFTVIQMSSMRKIFFVKTDPILAFLNFALFTFIFMTGFLVPQYLIQNSFRTLFAKSCLKLLPLEIKPFMVNILIRIDKIRSCYFCKYKNTEAITPEGHLEPCQTFRIER